uniref:Uncharacterized protein n=1 Tax=Arion vulgaris TaxID=1028688 RepID=A0A0B7B914_9EUPU
MYRKYMIKKVEKYETCKIQYSDILSLSKTRRINCVHFVSQEYATIFLSNHVCTQCSSSITPSDDKSTPLIEHMFLIDRMRH